MKKLVLALMLLLPLVAVAEPNDVERDKSITTWLNIGNFDEGNIDTGLWLGYRQPANDNLDVEIGLAANYQEYEVDEGDKEHNTAFGAYAVLHSIGLLDVNMPEQYEGFPMKLIGEPFISIEYLKNVDEGQSFGIGTGARIFDLTAFKVQYNIIRGVPVDDHLVLSLSLRFRF